MKKISILVALLIMSPISFASSCPDGSEPIKSISDDGTYYIYTCNQGNSNNAIGNANTSSNNSTSESNNSEIKIYEVSFAPEVLDELLNLVVSKTDFDFSEYKLTKNEDDFQCRFRMSRIVYENIKEGKEEPWSIAEGNINIRGSNVEFGNNAKWRMGGLSSDPSYLIDQVNLRLTSDGHFVGKMAYFNLHVDNGEVPINPMYPILTKHKRSTPINLNNLTNTSAKLFVDVEDWAGGVMYIRNCRKI
ncbi:MAG: hypothetical protein ACJ0DJ_14115 [bacterium]